LLALFTHPLQFAGVARFKYGVQSYEEVLQSDLFFVAHVNLLAEWPGNCLFLCRPKRHGKTLLCSLALCFYDAMNQCHFDKMFPGVNSTHFDPLPCSFMVLLLNFGGLQPYNVTSPDCGSAFELNFQTRLKDNLILFCEKYGLKPPPSENDAVILFDRVVALVAALKRPVSIMNLTACIIMNTN
jgi:hypothetical protein